MRDKQLLKLLAYSHKAFSGEFDGDGGEGFRNMLTQELTRASVMARLLLELEKDDEGRPVELWFCDLALFVKLLNRAFWDADLDAVEIWAVKQIAGGYCGFTATIVRGASKNYPLNWNGRGEIAQNGLYLESRGECVLALRLPDALPGEHRSMS